MANSQKRTALSPTQLGTLGTMQTWDATELLQLADALSGVDFKSFHVRRTLARLERFEITPGEAASTIRSIRHRRPVSIR